MKPTPKVKQTEAKPVVRETVYLKDVDSSNYLNFAQSLSANSIVIEEILEQQETP